MATLDLSLAKHFAWLLRADVRGQARASDSPNERFAQWWLVKGRAEYPAWSQLTPQEVTWLGESVGSVQFAGVDLTIPRMLRLVLSWRADVIQKFTIQDQADSLSIMAWFYLLGMREHHLIEYASLDLIRQLDQPVWVGERTSDDDVPAATVLMHLAWRLLGPELQKAMRLDESHSRNRFLAWFFTAGLNVFQCQGLIANRWRSWLLQPISLGPQLGEVPRFALLDYAGWPAKKKPDLKTVAGADALRLYGQSAALNAPTGKWVWLKKLTPITPPTVQAAGEAPVPAPALPKPFGLNLFGFAYGELGIGEDLRMAVASCEAMQIPYRIINIEPGQEIRQADRAVQEQLEQKTKLAPYAINVFILPGFDTAARVFLKLGPEVFAGHYNIGWWPWELGVWPKAWARAFELIDEVWAGSEFSHTMYSKATTKPAIAMPLATQLGKIAKRTRASFDLPLRSFLFLYVFDFNSHLERKNPLALLEAFKRAFKAASSPRVGLVLKVMNAKPKDPVWQEFEKKCKSDKRIHLIAKTMDRSEVLALMQVCDAYVSPHRAEGFGRTLSEAMLMGKPVIATNYSGNSFYMHPQHTFPVDYELVRLQQGDYHFVDEDDGALWAEPSQEHLAAQLQAVMTLAKPEPFREALLAYAQQTFSPRRTGQLMQARLESLKTTLIERGLL